MVDGSGNDGDDCGYIRRTCRFLTRRHIRDVCDVTPVSCPYEPGVEDSDPELLTGFTEGTQVVFKCRQR